MPQPSIQVSGLTKVYRSTLSSGVKALDALDLTVEAGEIFGLLGPNGAGKTTLVKILLSVVHPTQGTASLFGAPVKDPAARARIGFLPENHRFPEFLTPAQMLDLYGRLAGVPAATRKSRTEELLGLVNMGKWRDVKIKKFSKGMMQRVGIAQAMMNDPDLLFLDEPTDGVDPIGRREIRDVLATLQDRGKTIFLNSHLLSEVEQLCTSVAILNKGKKIREGAVDDLTRVETHFDLITTPIPGQLLTELAAKVNISEQKSAAELSTYRLAQADRAALNQVIDTLRQHNIEIDEVRPMRQSLEERFVAEVTVDN